MVTVRARAPVTAATPVAVVPIASAITNLRITVCRSQWEFRSSSPAAVKYDRTLGSHVWPKISPANSPPLATPIAPYAASRYRDQMDMQTDPDKAAPATQGDAWPR